MSRRLWDDYDAGDAAAEREMDRRTDEAVERDQERRWRERQAQERREKDGK